MPCEDGQLIRAADGSLLRDSQGRVVHQNAAAEPCCGETIPGCGVGSPVCSGSAPRYLRATPSLPGTPCTGCFHVSAGIRFVGHYGWGNTQILGAVEYAPGQFQCLWQKTGVVESRRQSFDELWCSGNVIETEQVGSLFVGIERSQAFPGRFFITCFGSMQSRTWTGVVDNLASCDEVFNGITIPISAGNGQGDNGCGQFDSPKSWYYSGTGPVQGSIFVVRS